MARAAILKLNTIRQIGLMTRDVARAVEFYRDRLGIRLLFEGRNSAFFECGGVRMMLGPGEGTGTVYFEVEEIEAATAELKGRGVEFERDPHRVARMPGHEVWLAFFRDPDGNRLALLCEKRG